jgi:hypothetical protein
MAVSIHSRERFRGFPNLHAIFDDTALSESGSMGNQKTGDA